MTEGEPAPIDAPWYGVPIEVGDTIVMHFENPKDRQLVLHGVEAEVQEVDDNGEIYVVTEVGDGEESGWLQPVKTNVWCPDCEDWKLRKDDDWECPWHD